MAYSVSMITLASEADALIKMAQRDKRNLEHRLQSFDIRNENSVEDAAEQAAELTRAQAALAASIALLPTLPEGPARKMRRLRK